MEQLSVVRALCGRLPVSHSNHISIGASPELTLDPPRPRPKRIRRQLQKQLAHIILRGFAESCHGDRIKVKSSLCPAIKRAGLPRLPLHGCTHQAFYRQEVSREKTV